MRRAFKLAAIYAFLWFVLVPTGWTQGTHSITLSWNASTGATSYNVKRGTASNAETTLSSVAGTSFIDTTGTGGVTYFYVITAVNIAGESAPSNEVSATFLLDKPNPPTGLKAVTN